MKKRKAVLRPVMLMAALAMLTSCAVTIEPWEPLAVFTESAGESAPSAEKTEGSSETGEGAHSGESSDNAQFADSAIITEDGLTPMHISTGCLSPDMGEWTFVLYGREGPDGGFDEMTLHVYGETGQRIYREIQPDVSCGLIDAHVMPADANFDGYRDVLYTEGPVGAHGHISYHLLLWDSGESTLIPMESFSEILNPVIDAKDQVIRSLAANSAFKDDYRIYSFRDGEFHIDEQLILTRGESYGKECWVYGFINLLTVSRSFVSR